MGVRQIGIMPGGGSSSSSTSTATARKRVQGGRGLLAGDADTQVARSLLVSGLLRGRNLDAVGGDPEVWALSTDAIIAKATIAARGAAQQILIEPDIFECDIVEVQFFSAVGSTPAALSAMQGGIYTDPPQADGTPYPDTAVVDWGQSYAAWAGGYRVLVVQPIRQRLQPVDLWWIPKVKPAIDFTFQLRVKATCDWWQGSADPNPRVD
ncbi:hypothetical protein [Methylobacterium sp. E-045]|uniref:hypothetical protein n=1 Tax=Methylobacterium sp. E-045 TaxID=2836575 RepID=UPI001FBB3135|nr:hypothetical protein [Methylobacterium sp. E-045]MCJ2132442.1 hypothetical protein [Methylobacterium sp. E-045]